MVNFWYAMSSVGRRNTLGALTGVTACMVCSHFVLTKDVHPAIVPLATIFALLLGWWNTTIAMVIARCWRRSLASVNGLLGLFLWLLGSVAMRRYRFGLSLTFATVVYSVLNGVWIVPTLTWSMGAYHRHFSITDTMWQEYVAYMSAAGLFALWACILVFTICLPCAMWGAPFVKRLFIETSPLSFPWRLLVMLLAPQLAVVLASAAAVVLGVAIGGFLLPLVIVAVAMYLLFVLACVVLLTGFRAARHMVMARRIYLCMAVTLPIAFVSAWLSVPLLTQAVMVPVVILYTSAAAAATTELIRRGGLWLFTKTAVGRGLAELTVDKAFAALIP